MAAPVKTKGPVGSIDARTEAPVSIAPIDSSAQLDPLAKLDALVAAAMMASSAEQQKLAVEINAMMKLARETVGGRRTADELLGLLHSRKLDGFATPDGKTCRSVAVEQVLALGFPFALEVMPEDLEHHRAQERPISLAARVLLGLLAAVSAGTPWLALWPSVGDDPSILGARLPFALGLGAITALIAVLMMFNRPASRRAKWLRRFLVLAGLLGFVVGGFAGLKQATWPGAFAAVLTAATLMPRRKDG